MAVDVTLNTIVSGYNITKINENFESIETALEDAVSRSGVSPNGMSADIDMNSNDLLNVKDIDVSRLFVNGTEFVASAASAVGDKGWAPVFAVVEDGANRVLQLVAYVGGEGDTPTDNIGEYVSDTGYTSTIGDATNIRGATGASGPGSGDMVGSNNLSDVSSTATAFATIKQAASETATGVVELATTAEAVTGTDTARAVTPAGVAAAIASATTTGYTFLARQVFTSSGSYTPTSGATLIHVVMCGGGGGGGSARATDSGEGSAAAAGGGGGGETIDFWILISAITTPVTVTIGARGNGASAGGSATSGGTTSFGSYGTADGGDAGGSISTSDYSGTEGGVAGSGGTLPAGGLSYGGEDGGPGTVGDGGAGATLISTLGGNGGGSKLGGGGRGRYTRSGSDAGGDGNGYGAGGGGAASKSTGGASGGNGTAGLVIINEYTSG